MPIQKASDTRGLGEILEMILDKGIVIAGDIKVSLADIELLTIRIRLVIASVDKAVEMGIDWWKYDPYLSSNAKLAAQKNVNSEKVRPPGEKMSLPKTESQQEETRMEEDK